MIGVVRHACSTFSNPSKRTYKGLQLSKVRRPTPLRPFSCSPRTNDDRTSTSSKQLDNLYDDLTKTPPPISNTSRNEIEAKARVVFGSRLAGPAERRRELDASSRRIAGVLVPPRPEEPDNCCMSGCVNCVWDRYRDELEEWAAKSAEARAKIEARAAKDVGEMDGQETLKKLSTDTTMPTHVTSSMDDDGGGSEALWDAGDEGFLLESGKKAEDILSGVPVGIREFIKNEKKLRDKKAAAAAAASTSATA